MKFKKINLKFPARGQMLVELLLTMGIAAVIFPALLTGFVATRGGKAQQIQRMQAITLLKETEEAVRSIKNQDWTTFAGLSDGTIHSATISAANKWTAVSGPLLINGLTVQFTVSDVNRDSSGAIFSSGTPDASTKRVDITISWTQPSVSSIISTMYLTRTTNLTWTHTTFTDFNGSGVSLNSTAVATTSGTSIAGDGEVLLGSGGGGDWCNPQKTVQAKANLPGQGVTKSISATAGTNQNFAYTTTGGNSSGDTTDGVSISHDSTPIASVSATYNDSSSGKGYGIFVDSADKYVYVDENKPHTVRILNGGNLTDAGYYDSSCTGGSCTGSSIYISGNIGFTTLGSNLYSFDVTTIKGISTSQSEDSHMALAGTGQRVMVVGNNAYVATSNTTNQLQIIPFNTSNGTFGTAQNINLGNGQGAVDLFVDSTQTYAYVVTSYISGQNNIFIIQLSNKSIIKSLSTNGMNPKGIAVVSGGRAIVVGSGGIEYQVFNTSTPTASYYCGGMSPANTTSVNAVSPVDQGGNAYAYILTDDASNEFQAVLGGNGSLFPGVGVPGTYESPPFDPGFNSAYNKFIADIAAPSTTNISLQVGVAQQQLIGGVYTCIGASYTYVGPSGTSSDSYVPSGGQITGIIPFATFGSYYLNPSRCFRYKVTMSTNDATQTPEFFDMTWNYSP